MTCNFLGALCNTCETPDIDSINCCPENTCFCFHKTVFLIGHIDNLGESAPSQHRVDRSDPLMRMVKVVTTQREQIHFRTQTVNKLSNIIIEDRERAIRSGIFAKTVQCLGEMKKENSSFDNTWRKLRLACALADVNLEHMYVIAQPLTVKDFNQLEKCIGELGEYEYVGFALWTLVCTYLLDWTRMKKLQLLPDKQLKFLQKKLNNVTLSRLQRSSAFLYLDEDLQLTFIEAAKLSSKEFKIASNLQALLAEQPDRPTYEGSVIHHSHSASPSSVAASQKANLKSQFLLIYDSQRQEECKKD